MLRAERATFCLPWFALIVAGCAPAPPPKMDTAALPSATTSAKPLYISTEPAPVPTPSPSGTSRYRPVEPNLPKSVSLELSQTAACSEKQCWRSWVVPRPRPVDTPPTNVQPDLGVPAPVAVWQEKLNANVKLDFPRAKGLGLLGVVLGGVVTVAASEGGTLAAMKTWGAFSAPGVGLTLTSHDEGGAVLLVAFPLEGSLEDRIAAVRKSDKAVYWEQRPGRFAVDDLERIERQTWAGGAAHAWLGFDKNRSPKAYLGLLMTNGEMPMADHEHNEAWEVLVPIRAKGTLVLSGKGVSSGGSFPRRIPVRPGDVIMMPPTVHHAFEPGGADPLFAIQLFVPPGPEQRFRNLAKASESSGSGPPNR